MKKKLIYPLFLVQFLVLGPLLLTAQEFSIKKIEVTADQVVVHYDLIDTTRYRTYTIRAYSSVDKFLAPLTKVTGDAGLEVVPGTNKKIVWNSKEELGASFIGNVEIEVRGRVYIPFIRLVGFEDLREVKRTKPFIVKWTGGSRQNILNFQLYNKSDQLVYTPPNAPNESEYEIEIPRSVKPGKGYYFMISDSKNADQMVKSPSFNIKSKYPFYLKVASVVAVGTGAYFIIKALGEDEIDGPPDHPTETN